MGDRGRHLPEGRKTPAPPDLELRVPQPLVGLLELAVLVGEGARRLPDARLEARGQLLDAREHPIQAAGEERELPAAGGLHADAAFAALGALHAGHQRGDRTRHPPLEEEGQRDADEERRAAEDREVDHHEVPLQAGELFDRELHLGGPDEGPIATERDGDPPHAGPEPLAIEAHRAAVCELRGGVRGERLGGRCVAGRDQHLGRAPAEAEDVDRGDLAVALGHGHELVTQRVRIRPAPQRIDRTQRQQRALLEIAFLRVLGEPRVDPLRDHQHRGDRQDDDRDQLEPQGTEHGRGDRLGRLPGEIHASGTCAVPPERRREP